MDRALLDDDRAGSSRRKVHLVGIAGSGMRSLAAVLLSRGWLVSGSDQGLIDHSSFAELPGVQISPGHQPTYVPVDADLVIHSDAIPADNCELKAAAELGIQIIRYPEMLARLMSAGRGIAVAGTHGKSTTTAITAEILNRAGLAPTVICGALPCTGTVPFENGLNVSASDERHQQSCQPDGQGIVLVEACEYRQNFLQLHPQAAVILNIEADHFDCYADQQAVESSFARFAAQVDPAGALIVNADSPAALRVAQSSRAPVSTFGFTSQSDWIAEDIKQSGGFFSFDLVHRCRVLGRVEMGVPGLHNVSNALAAGALASTVGASEEAILAGICGFQGVCRRLQQRGSVGEVPWVDDYAHHPTEISASLQAVRQMVPEGRLWCIFEPHQASRLSALLDEFAVSLQNTDCVFVTEIFRARELKAHLGEPGPQDLAARICELGGNAAGVHRAADIEELLLSAMFRQELGPQDVIVTLGAGNVERIPNGLIQRLREYCAAG